MEASDGTSKASGRPRVLVVDDDPLVRLLCAETLSLGGYEVIEAVNGQDALDIALTWAPDFVLLDISMPMLDGFGVAAALRADDRTRELPFVFLTGELDPHVIERGYELGAAHVFAKPFDPAVIGAFVRRTLGDFSAGKPPVPLGGHAF